MNFNRLFLPLGLACGLLSSCLYPYPPNPHDPLQGGSPDPAGPDSSLTSDHQGEIREARDKVRREQKSNADEPSPEPRNTGTNPPPKKDYRVAVPIPGKEGFVFNPFTNDPVDVRAIPSLTLVRDPNDPDPEHKFRVP